MITQKQRLAIRHAALRNHPCGGHSLARDIDRECRAIREELGMEKNPTYEAISENLFDILKSCPPCDNGDWGKNVTELSAAETRRISEELGALVLAHFQGVGIYTERIRKMYFTAAKLCPAYLAYGRNNWWEELMQGDPYKVLDLCDEWLVYD